MPLPDKQEFLEKLRQALIERDISETDIAPYIERFDRFFERMTNDPENDRSDLLSDIDRIADQHRRPDLRALRRDKPAC